MKTLREILLQRHGAAKPRLDEIRKTVVGNLCDQANEPAEEPPHPILAWFQSFRWHLAGLGAAWIAIALLNIDDSASSDVQAVASEKSEAQKLVLALRENRRQLLELMELVEPVPLQQPNIPQRRGELQPATVAV